MSYTTGIFDIPLAEYLADPCPTMGASATVLRTMIDLSPAHARLAYAISTGESTATPEWWSAYDLEKPYRRDAAIGSVFHAVFLGKGAEYEVIDPADHPGERGAIPTGWTNKSIRGARDMAVNAGLTPILKADFETVQEMVEAAETQLRHHAIGDFRQRGTPEQTAIWREHGVWCRACIDLLPDDIEAERAIYNLKTAACAHPDVWEQRVLWRSGHDFSATHYNAAIFHTSLGCEVNERFVVIERKPPYALSVIDLGAGALHMAEKRRQAALKWWAQCVETNSWPAYPDSICTIALPPGYREARQSEKELAGHYDPAMLDNLMELART